MPKVSWSIDINDEPEDLGSFEDYDGPTPPTGVYPVVLKRLSLKENRNGDDMFNGLLEIRGATGDKAKYNGYAFWFNQNVNQQGMRFLKPFIVNGLGAKWSDLANTVTEDDGRPTKVIKIGKVQIDGREVPMKVSATFEANAQYGDRLTNPRFLPRTEDATVPAQQKWEPEGDDSGDDDAPF